MTSNIPTQSPFLRTTRTFPEESQPLSVEINKAYVDIANAMNSRTVGIYPTNRPIVNGESFFVTSSRQQVLQQVYTFSDSSLTISHGINFASVSYFKPIQGAFFDGTSWQDLPYVDVTAANNQINVRITSTQIIITKGGGSPPAIVKGILIVQWLSNP